MANKKFSVNSYQTLIEVFWSLGMTMKVKKTEKIAGFDKKCYNS